MFLCYIDESGTPELEGNTSHFILCGLAIPSASWKRKDAKIQEIKTRFALDRDEIHTGWMARRYVEQERIAGFETMPRADRRAAVAAARKARLLYLSASSSAAKLHDTTKKYAKTEAYIHLTNRERIGCLEALADEVGSWDDSRLFADAIDKRVFGGTVPPIPPEEEAFTQVVSRFHSFIAALSSSSRTDEQGLLIADNNDTTAKRFTQLMRVFHRKGTLWTRIPRLVETPLFVDSELTGMIQMADVCAYVTRRFFENGETALFDRIYPRFNREGRKLVGLRHFTGKAPCTCRVCTDHNARP